MSVLSEVTTFAFHHASSNWNFLTLIVSILKHSNVLKYALTQCLGFFQGDWCSKDVYYFYLLLCNACFMFLCQMHHIWSTSLDIAKDSWAYLWINIHWQMKIWQRWSLSTRPLIPTLPYCCLSPWLLWTLPTSCFLKRSCVDGAGTKQCVCEPAVSLHGTCINFWLSFN